MVFLLSLQRLNDLTIFMPPFVLNAWIQLGYIDPGTGALILQCLVAVFVGSALFFRNFLVRIFRAVFRKKSADPRSPF